jgi:hypothetical protein
VAREAREAGDLRIALVIRRICLALADRQKPYRYLETRPEHGHRFSASVPVLLSYCPKENRDV